MNSTIVPHTLKVLNSHIELVLYPAFAEENWSKIESFGDEVEAEILERNRPVCIVDLSNLSYMGSSLVALIVRFWKVISRQNGQLAIVAPHPVVKETLALAGLDKIWNIYLDVDQACRSVGVKPSSMPRSSSKRKKILIGVIVAAVVIGLSIFVFSQQYEIFERFSLKTP